MTMLLSRHETPTAESDIAFLRNRCSQLQRALTAGCDPEVANAQAAEGHALSRWTALLVPNSPWPPATQQALEDLYVQQARVLERLSRGGVGDISPQVESLVRALLIDRLQRLTDAAVAAIS